jgi:hypothetical protein
MSALMLSGCVAAGVATVAAGTGLGVAFTQDQPETTASAAPAGGSDMTMEPAAAGGLDDRGPPVAANEASDWRQPTDLVRPTVPVESVEVQSLQ